MQAKIPVLAVTDPNTDIGTIILNEGFGWWIESNDVSLFRTTINQITCSNNLKSKGQKGYISLLKYYTTSKGYEIITNSLGEKR